MLVLVAGGDSICRSTLDFSRIQNGFEKTYNLNSEPKAWLMGLLTLKHSKVLKKEFP